MYHGISDGWLSGWLRKSDCDWLLGRPLETGFMSLIPCTEEVAFIFVSLVMAYGLSLVGLPTNSFQQFGH